MAVSGRWPKNWKELCKYDPQPCWRESPPTQWCATDKDSQIPGSTGSYGLSGHWVLKLLPHFKPYLCKEPAGVDIGQLILKKLLKHTDYIFPCREIPWGMLSECEPELGQVAARFGRREKDISQQYLIPDSTKDLCKILHFPCYRVSVFVTGGG